jgi:hypothetical protein
VRLPWCPSRAVSGPSKVTRRHPTTTDEGFAPQHTSVIEADGTFAGSVALRPAEDGTWLEHFYLDPGLRAWDWVRRYSAPCWPEPTPPPNPYA